MFGAQGEHCAQYLAKGRQVAVDGRLRWRQWESQDGQKRSKVEVVADSVQFIGPRDAGASGGGFNRAAAGSPEFDETGLDVPETDFQEDDDIPF